MPSEARQAFDQNVEDISQLLELHRKEGGDQKGRRHGLEVLNKSAVVLITAFWESYCEDIASEGLVHLVEHLASAEELPDRLKKRVADALKAEKHEHAVWQIADQGWRDYLLEATEEPYIHRFNSPKADRIDKLFEDALGIKAISDSWKLPRMDPGKCRKRLAHFVEMRGAIAHRGHFKQSVKKPDVVKYLNLVKGLAAKTGRRVNSHVRHLTGTPLWT